MVTRASPAPSGPRCTSASWTGLHAALGASPIFGQPHRHTATIKVERVNGDSADVPRSFAGERADDWTDFVPLVEFAIIDSASLLDAARLLVHALLRRLRPAHTSPLFPPAGSDPAGPGEAVADLMGLVTTEPEVQALLQEWQDRCNAELDLVTRAGGRPRVVPLRGACILPWAKCILRLDALRPPARAGALDGLRRVRRHVGAAGAADPLRGGPTGYQRPAPPPPAFAAAAPPPLPPTGFTVRVDAAPAAGDRGAVPGGARGPAGTLLVAGRWLAVWHRRPALSAWRAQVIARSGLHLVRRHSGLAARIHLSPMVPGLVGAAVPAPATGGPRPGARRPRLS
jgi:hypothetical protein